MTVPVRKLPALLVCVAFVAAAGGVGYLLGSLHQDSPVLMLARQTPGLDYLFAAPSFSEVQNARAQLEGLANHWLTELRQRRYAAGLLTYSAARAERDPVPRPELAKAIVDLQKAVAEFSGTGQERFLIQDLFILLKTQHLDQRWVEVYLHVLYEHPTDPLVGGLAHDALTLAEAAGRKQEILRAFRHMSEIPLEFPGKSQIDAICRCPNPGEASSQLQPRTITNPQQQP